jgi:peptidoglycan lytic transglycosylase
MGQESVSGLKGLVRVSASMALALLLANCAATSERVRTTTYSPKMVADGEPVPRGGGAFKLGKPYTVNGRIYYPTHDPSYRADGIASWYGSDFHGRKTANGEVYDMNAISAAHPTMPLPSYARVTNLENGRSIIVRVNDRGPYAPGRIIDLSTATARALGSYGQGLARVRVEYVGRAGLAGSDDATLLASLRHGTPAPAPSVVRLAARSPAPSTSSSRALDITPLPLERPYALGDGVVRASARAAPAPRPLTRQNGAQAPVRAIPAYAASEPPAGAVEPIGALSLTSGRGLY